MLQNMKMRVVSILAVLTVIVLCFCSAIHAESEKKGTITGYVRDQAGKQLNHSKVSIIPKRLGSAPAPQSRPEIRNQGYGYFECPDLAPGAYTLEARHPDYPKAAKGDIVIFSDDYRPSMDIYMGAENAVTGRVVEDFSGTEAGVAGVNMRISGYREAKTPEGTAYHDSVVLNAVTREDGSFQINAPPNCTLNFQELRKGTFRDQKHEKVNVKNGSIEKPLIFRIPAMGEITGIVTDPEKKPVAGAEVSLFGLFGPPRLGDLSVNGQALQKTISDSGGRFALRDFSLDGYYGLVTQAKGFAPTRTEVPSGIIRQEVNVELKRGGVISGKVLDAESRKALPGISIRIERCSGTAVTSNLIPEAITDESGSFLIDVPVGRWAIRGFDRSETNLKVIESKDDIEVAESQSVENVELLAYPSAEISGMVLLQKTGQPVAEANVGAIPKTTDGVVGSASLPFTQTGKPRTRVTSWDQRSAQSDAQGNFKLIGLLPGMYDLGVQKSGYPSSFERKTISVKTGEKVTSVLLLMSEGGTVSGIVVDERNQPAPQKQVQLMPRFRGKGSDMPSPEGVTDASGRFSFNNLPLNGSPFRIITAESSYGPFGASNLTTLTNTKSNIELNVRLIPGTDVSGTVRANDGSPIAGASVEALASYLEDIEDWPFRCSTSTDPAGRYNFRQLAPGKYRLNVHHEKFAGKDRELAVLRKQNLSSVDFALEPAKPMTTLTGILLDQNSRRLGGWDVTAERRKPDGGYDYIDSISTDAQGRFELKKVREEGACRLRMSWSDAERHQQMAMIMPSQQSISPPKQGNRAYVFVLGDISVSNQPVQLVLPFGGGLKGRVLYGDNREPLKGAWITLDMDPATSASQPSGTQCKLERAELSTGEGDIKSDGSFEISDLPSGVYRASVHSNKTPLKRITGIAANPGSVNDLQDIVLEGECIVTGRLLKESRQGYTSKTLGAFSGYSQDPDYLHCSARNAAGQRVEGIYGVRIEQDRRFRIGRLPSDAVMLILCPSGCLPLRLDLKGLSAIKPLNLGDIETSSGAKIRGKLLGPAGEPAKNARVWISFQFEGETYQSSGISNDTGDFEIAGCPSGPAAISAQAYRDQGNPWIDRETKMAQIKDRKITISDGGTGNLEIRFPVPSAASTNR